MQRHKIVTEDCITSSSSIIMGNTVCQNNITYTGMVVVHFKFARLSFSFSNIVEFLINDLG